MQIVVTELPIGDAVGRARERFQQADRHLARVLDKGAAGVPWLAAGAMALAGGGLGLSGMVPLSAEVSAAAGLLLKVGGALVGFGFPLWANARGERRRRSRQWHHALQMVRLREQQAADNPHLTVEVLDRVDGPQQLLAAKWRAHSAAAAHYVQ